MKNRIIHSLAVAASLIVFPAFLNSCASTGGLADYFKLPGLSVLPNEIPRNASPRTVRSLLGEPAWTQVVGDDLELMSVSRTSALPGKGHSLVIVALVDTDLHVRTFDGSGKRVIDKPERDLVHGQELNDLKALLNSPPSNLSPKKKQEIIDKAVSSAGYPFGIGGISDCRTYVWHYEDRWHTDGEFGSWNIYFQEIPPRKNPEKDPRMRYVGWRLTEPRSFETGGREAFHLPRRYSF